MAITAENLAEQYKISRAGVRRVRAALAEGAGPRPTRAAASRTRSRPSSCKSKKGADPVRGRRASASADDGRDPGQAAARSSRRTASSPPATPRHRDGAAALVICSKEAGLKNGLKPLAEITQWAFAGCDPKIMGIGPAPAIRTRMDKRATSSPTSTSSRSTRPSRRSTSRSRRSSASPRAHQRRRRRHRARPPARRLGRAHHDPPGVRAAPPWQKLRDRLGLHRRRAGHRRRRRVGLEHRSKRMGAGDSSVLTKSPSDFTESDIIYDWNALGTARGLALQAQDLLLRRDAARRPAEPVGRRPQHRRQAQARST